MPILIVTKIKNLQEVRGGTGEKVTGGADFCRPKRLEYLLCQLSSVVWSRTAIPDGTPGASMIDRVWWATASRMS
jgi:hypothetical protein